MIVKSFNEAGIKAWLLGATHDFADLDVPGLMLNGAIVHGWGAIDASTGAAQANWTEYDLTLDYRFKAAQWPILGSRPRSLFRYGCRGKHPGLPHHPKL